MAGKPTDLAPYFGGYIVVFTMKGVIVAQCANTLREKDITRDKIFDFVGIVPSGNGELIIRQAEGWTVVKS